ncbi:MAG TPA: hypothetical protein GX530_10260 [Corynebacteriales bacterium]|nr:hypothetical protein [Mycobacteriales bacterium]
MPTGFTTDQRKIITNKYYYAPEYFSGCDVRIYINGQYVDEAITIAFELQEKVAPIYGYASVTYDALAQGTKIVQGYLDIAFRRAGYLYYLLDKIRTSDASTYNTAAAKPLSSSVKLPQAASVSSDAAFQSWCQAYEEAIWGKSLTRVNMRAAGNSYKQEVVDSGAYGSKQRVSEMLQSETTFSVGAFDILITYGEFNGVTQLGNTVGNLANKVNGTRPNLAQAPYTVNSINEVSLVGLSKTIEPSGAPIIERYPFIAKDINRPIARA